MIYLINSDNKIVDCGIGYSNTKLYKDESENVIVYPEYLNLTSVELEEEIEFKPNKFKIVDGIISVIEGYVEPEIIIPEISNNKKIEWNKLEFLALFTKEQRVAIWDSTDINVKDFVIFLTNAVPVRLDNQDTLNALLYLATNNYITQEQYDSLV